MHLNSVRIDEVMDPEILAYCLLLSALLHLGFQVEGRAPPGHSGHTSLLYVTFWDTTFDNECPFAGGLHENFFRVQRDIAGLRAVLSNLLKKGNVVPSCFNRAVISAPARVPRQWRRLPPKPNTPWPPGVLRGLNTKCLSVFDLK
jgi:hypothetical protein